MAKLTSITKFASVIFGLVQIFLSEVCQVLDKYEYTMWTCRLIKKSSYETSLWCVLKLVVLLSLSDQDNKYDFVVVLTSSSLTAMTFDSLSMSEVATSPTHG